MSELESKLTVARKEYQSFIAEDGSTALSALPEFAINDSFTLNQDEAWYTLTIETRVMKSYCLCPCTCTISHAACNFALGSVFSHNDIHVHLQSKLQAKDNYCWTNINYNVLYVDREAVLFSEV